MQWEASRNAGFSTGESWLPVNPDYVSRNVSVETSDPRSLLSWYRSLIALRRARPELRSGSITFLDLDREVLAYERAEGEGRLLVAAQLRLAPPGASSSRMPRASWSAARERRGSIWRPERSSWRLAKW